MIILKLSTFSVELKKFKLKKFQDYIESDDYFSPSHLKIAEISGPI